MSSGAARGTRSRAVRPGAGPAEGLDFYAGLTVDGHAAEVAVTPIGLHVRKSSVDGRWGESSLLPFIDVLGVSRGPATAPRRPGRAAMAARRARARAGRALSRAQRPPRRRASGGGGDRAAIALALLWVLALRVWIALLAALEAVAARDAPEGALGGGGGGGGGAGGEATEGKDGVRAFPWAVTVTAIRRGKRLAGDWEPLTLEIAEVDGSPAGGGEVSGRAVGPGRGQPGRLADGPGELEAAVALGPGAEGEGPCGAGVPGSAVPDAAGPPSPLASLWGSLEPAFRDARAFQRRPRRVLCVLNPASGARKAASLFGAIAAPLFAAAGVEVDLRATTGSGSAAVIVRSLTDAELGELDGIVAVGGDGAFHEVLDATLREDASPALARLRLGHLPAGSTDAVACSLHGTRSLFTAAAHVALGDDRPLDVLETRWWGGEGPGAGGASGATPPPATRYAACIAATGFMGQICRLAEAPWARALGPLRYDLLGAYVFLRSRPTLVSIAALRAPLLDPELEGDACSAHCRVCSGAGWSPRVAGSGRPPAECGPCRWLDLAGPGREDSAGGLGAAEDGSGHAGLDCGNGPASGARDRVPRPSPDPLALPGSEVGATSPLLSARASDPEAPPTSRPAGTPAPAYLSLMLIASPCVSDKTPNGMARVGHLSDGRATLAAVPARLGRLGMLRTLLALAGPGLAPGTPRGIDLFPFREAVVTSEDPEGIWWNLDGEPHRAQRVHVRVLPSRVSVFSRGIERA